MGIRINPIGPRVGRNVYRVRGVNGKLMPPTVLGAFAKNGVFGIFSGGLPPDRPKETNLRQEIERLSDLLINDNHATRKEAIEQLSQILDQVKHVKGKMDPIELVTVRVYASPLLAQAITIEREDTILLEMLFCAQKIGPGEPTMLEALVTRMKEPRFWEPGCFIGGAIMDTINSLGAPARFAAILQSADMELFHRIPIVAELSQGRRDLDEGVEREVMWMLANSKDDRNRLLLSETIYILERVLPRAEVKDALVTAWRMSIGVLKENLEYDLRKRGYRRIFSWWI